MTVLKGEKGLVADLLFVLGAVKIDTEVGFRVKLHEEKADAPLSPIYLNLRTERHPKKPGPLTDEVMGLIGRLMAHISMGIRGECFAGIPEAGEPFADQYWQVTGGKRVRLRKWERDGRRGIDLQIYGDYNPGDHCLVIDDLITHADSKLEAISALRHQNLQVSGVVVLVDRMQGGREQLEAAGYQLRSVFTLYELLDHYTEKSYINQAQAEKVRRYIVANQA